MCSELDTAVHFCFVFVFLKEERILQHISVAGVYYIQEIAGPVDRVEDKNSSRPHGI